MGRGFASLVAGTREEVGPDSRYNWIISDKELRVRRSAMKSLHEQMKHTEDVLADFKENLSRVHRKY